jgi:AI-2 transport protein TqsA
MPSLPETGKIKASKALLIFATLAIVIAGLKEAQTFLMPILIAAFIATISFPLLSLLREKKVTKPL